MANNFTSNTADRNVAEKMDLKLLLIYLLFIWNFDKSYLLALNF